MKTTVGGYHWITGVCHQLSRVTGWPVQFAPCAVDTDRCDEPTPEYSWTSDLHDGQRSIGTLHVLLHASRELDDSFLRACEYADLAAQLIQRVLLQQSGAYARPAPEFTEGVSSRTADAAADAWLQTVERVLDVGLRWTGFRSASLFVVDPQQGQLKLRAERTCDAQPVMMYSRPLAEAPFDVHALHGGPVIIRRREEEFSEWLADGMSLGVCHPITTPQGFQGTLWAFDRRDRRVTTREEKVLASMAVRLAELIEQSVLIQESALQRQLRAELRVASESQPQRRMQVEGAGGWCRIAARSESAREVGGDLCEILPLGNDRMLVAIGDAAGHSIPAAMVMASVRGGLRSMMADPAAINLTPETIINRLNNVLHTIVDADQFMTLMVAIADGRKGTLELASAGHPPALLIRDDEVQPLEASGLVLGVVADATYELQRVSLEAGDVIALYTDGVSEAPGRGRRRFDTGGIAEVIRDQVPNNPDLIVERVWTALEDHITPDHEDDRTLLLIHYTGLANRPTEYVRQSFAATH